MDKKKKKKKISVEEMSFLKKLFANPYRSYSKKEQKFPLTLCVIPLQTANGFNISGKLCIKYLYGYDVTPKFVFCFFF